MRATSSAKPIAAKSRTCAKCPSSYTEAQNGIASLVTTFWGGPIGLTSNAVLAMGDGKISPLEALSFGNIKGTGLVSKHADEVADIVKIHKNSLEFVGETHVYGIYKNGKPFKVGESAQGVRIGDGASIRAEQQARKLTLKTGDVYTSKIHKIFSNKAEARVYETELIIRYRQRYGDWSLPGNRGNR